MQQFCGEEFLHLVVIRYFLQPSAWSDQRLCLWQSVKNDDSPVFVFAGY